MTDKIPNIEADRIEARAEFVRAELDRFKITVDPQQGIGELLALMSELTSKQTSQHPADTVHKLHAFLVLSENLRRCTNAGLETERYLREMVTGVTVFGTPGIEHHDHFYKDFEFELFIASHLIGEGLNVEEVPNADEPGLDFRVGNIDIELYHPDSKQKMGKKASSFNQKLLERDSYGVFGHGVEDAYHLEEKAQASTEEELATKINEARKEMEQNGLRLLNTIARHHKRILGVFITSTAVYTAGDRSQLVRHGNAVVFDERKPSAPSDVYEDAIRVLQAFRWPPNPYSKVASSDEDE